MSTEERTSIALKLSGARIRLFGSKDKLRRLSDGGGLSLEIRPSGSCLWRYRYRIDGKENVYAIGSFPEISLKAARAARDEARKLVQRGVPAHHRKAERLRAQQGNPDTFATVASEWLDASKSRWGARSFQQRRRLLERDILPAIGELPIREVTAGRCVAALRQIEIRAPQAATLARQCIGAISRFAIMTHRSDRDLGYALKRILGPASGGHRRQLSDTEIPKFFDALDRYPGHPPTVAAIRLLWLTLARPKEVLTATWEEFDVDRAIWAVPAQKMIPPGSHTVALSRQALEVLQRLRAGSRGSPYLTPNRIDPRRHAAQSLLIKALAKMGYSGTLTPYGIRLTGRAILVREGYPRGVLESQLGYADARSAPAGGREAACREMMQWWADYVDALCADEASRRELQLM